MIENWMIFYKIDALIFSNFSNTAKAKLRTKLEQAKGGQRQSSPAWPAQILNPRLAEQTERQVD